MKANITLGEDEQGEEVGLNLEEEGLHTILVIGKDYSGKRTFLKYLYSQLVRENAPEEICFACLGSLKMGALFSNNSVHLYMPPLMRTKACLNALSQLKEELTSLIDNELMPTRNLFVHIENNGLLQSDTEGFVEDLWSLIHKSGKKINTHVLLCTENLESLPANIINKADLKVTLTRENDEVRKLATWKDQHKALYPFDTNAVDEIDNCWDNIYQNTCCMIQAIKVGELMGYLSISLLQRKLKIGYNRAADIMDLLEEMDLTEEGEKYNERLINVRENIGYFDFLKVAVESSWNEPLESMFKINGPVEHESNVQPGRNCKNASALETLKTAALLFLEADCASTSFMSRKLNIGYNRAADIMEELEKLGIVSMQSGSKRRLILISDTKQLDAIFKKYENASKAIETNPKDNANTELDGIQTNNKTI